MRLQTLSRVDYKSGTMTKLDSKELTGHAKSTKFRIVCKTCNNGWMSKIEESAKPILEPIIQGDTLLLDKTMQFLLSRWLSLKVLVIDNTAGNPIASKQTRDNFRSDPQPLSGMTAWIARCDAASTQSALFRQTATIANKSTTPLTEDIPQNVQTVSIGVGNCFFHIHHNTSNAHIDSYFSPGGRFFQIWPIVTDVVFWPPIWSLTAFEVSEVANFLSKFSVALRSR